MGRKSIMDQTIINMALVVCAALLLLWPLARAHAQPIPKMAVEELKLSLDTRAPLLLIDVRTPPEWQDGVIDGTERIPMNRIPAVLPTIKTKQSERPEAGVVVVCHSGARATRVAAFLIKSGVPRVSVMQGGMIAWKAAGYRTVSPRG